MNKKYLSIGDMAKFHNLSIQTLRLYDRIDLFKPSYVNKNTGYRYYSIEQFFILDVIKYLKFSGLSLEKIKEILSNGSDINLFFQALNEQHNNIDKKIKELQNIKSIIDNKLKEIDKYFDLEDLNMVYIQHMDTMNILPIKSNYNENSDLYDLEIPLRKAMNIFEENGIPFLEQVGLTVSYNSFVKNRTIKYLNTFVEIPKDIKLNLPISTLNAGDYLCIKYIDSYKKKIKYYEILYKYIVNNNIEVEGNFYETALLSWIPITHEDVSLFEISIKIKDAN